MAPALELRPIDLDRHADLCVPFWADAFVISFGSADRFHRESGPGHAGFLARIRTMMDEIPGSCVHAWSGDEVVGQLELRRDPDDPRAGFVSLIYLVEAARGTDAGDRLHGYLERFFREHGMERAWLRVSPTNRRAWAWYERRGWRDLGVDPDHPEVHRMELTLDDLADEPLPV